MFARIKHFVGQVDVSVKNGIVKVEGVPTHVLSSDIKRLWGTSKIENNLFIEVDDYGFTFYEFFCVEVYYAISRLIEDRKARANRRTLAKVLEQLKEHTWLAKLDAPVASKLNYERLHQFTLVPLDFQQKFFEAYDRVTQQRQINGMLLAGAAGSGKTFTSLALVEMLEADLVVVVCPKNALERVWEDTLLTKFKEPPTFWMCTSTRAYEGQKYLIVNYEYLTKLMAMIGVLMHRKLAIILDESHNFNEVKSMRTELLIELCLKTQCKNVLWMSGTPIKALAVEAIPFIRCIDPLFTAEVEVRFKKIFGVSSERATDILSHRLEDLLFKIEKKELDVLPPIFKEIKVQIPNAKQYTLDEIGKAMRKFTEERELYYAGRKKQDEKTYYDAMDLYARQLSRNKKEGLAYYYRCLDVVIRCQGDARFCKDEMVYCNRYEAKEIVPVLPKALRDGFKEAKTIVKYVKLKIQGECLGRIVGRARINAHIDMADHLDYVAVVESTEKKTVVFTSFTEVIDKLKTYLPEQGLQPLFVYAKTNHLLSSILGQFETVDTLNPLVATFASLSTAVPLIMADTMIMLDAPFRDYQLQQTVSRISRIGATTQTYVYTAILDTGDVPNISGRSFDILRWSQQAVEKLTGVQSPFEISDNLEQANLALESLDLQADPKAEDFEHLETKHLEALENWGTESVGVVIDDSPPYLSW